ncbi:MAG: ferrous iron transport protein B [Bacillota bacterium]|nr:ferrous iron transport protein B [Bacillota bacterium]
MPNFTEKTPVMQKTKMKTITIALAGNPNCGKTTLFNQLTGSNQYVGNWPGVTVEKKEGKVKYDGNYDISIIDLPGIYSLSPYTPEEIVSRNCLMNDAPDVIINIVDATNIERNLYLTTQLMELSRPMVIALNMVDVLEKNGDKIDYDLLSKKLRMPVVPISASRGTGLDKLIKTTVETAEFMMINEHFHFYSAEVENVLYNIEDALSEVNSNMKNKRWNAVKLFEGDHITWKQFKFTKAQKDHIDFHIGEIKTTKNFDREMIIADQRYKFVCAVCQKAVHKKHSQGHLTITDKVDKIVTNKYFALPLFFAVMFIVFFITFGQIGGFFKSGANWLITGVFSNFVSHLLVSLNASSWARSLVVDGVIGGVGAVLSFLPQVTILFLLLSFLEDSGYMARAAFIMDKFFRALGLSGRAFVPMLMGFGCSVPAILSTRTLENEKDKRLTILMTPFMSCSAKMPVYLLFISIFFQNNSPFVIFSIYLTGIIIAVVTALIFKNTLLKGKTAPFVMELPPYRLPSPKTLLLHIWDRVKDFLVRAGTLILGATIVIWFLQSFNSNLQMTSNGSNSILASFGRLIAPIFSLCGFNDWKAAVSLLTGLIAKESVVSTMAVLYPGSALSGAFTQLSAFSFLIFVLLYTPCIAAMSAIYKEMNSKKWTLVAIVYQLFVAWFISALVYNVGWLIGIR